LAGGVVQDEFAAGVEAFFVDLGGEEVGGELEVGGDAGGELDAGGAGVEGVEVGAGADGEAEAVVGGVVDGYGVHPGVGGEYGGG